MNDDDDKKTVARGQTTGDPESSRTASQGGGSQHTPGPWRCRPLQGREAIADCRVYELDSLGADVLPADAIANAMLIAAAPDLLDAVKECRVAVAAAMRVITDLDAMKRLGAEADTYQQRFVDELHVSGVKDGFGVRAETAIKKAEGHS